MLEGLKVVELATYIAAPGAGGVLADWGAEVVKIEAPGGDPIRLFFASIGHESEANPVFDFDNRGKKGIVLDISKPAGRGALLRLLETADVFLTNLRPSALERARLEPATLRSAFPRLVYCSVSGYGLTGPDADRPGFDIASFWSRSGVAGLTTPKGEEPFPIRTGMGDHVTSLAAVAAILAALHERSRTGAGGLVEASLLRSGVYSVSSDLAIQLRFGRLASNRRRKEAINPLSNFFKTKDGRWICLVPRQGSADFAPLAKALGLEALLQDERFAGARSRRTHAAALVEILDRAFAELTFAEAADTLDAADLVWEPVQGPAEVVADPQAAAAGCFVNAPDGAGGAYPAPAGPVRFSGRAPDPHGPAPKLGEHTREVLEAHGFGPDEIAALFAEGAAA